MLLLSQRPVQRPERLYIPQNTRADSRDGHDSTQSLVCPVSSVHVQYSTSSVRGTDYGNDRNTTPVTSLTVHESEM